MNGRYQPDLLREKITQVRPCVDSGRLYENSEGLLVAGFSLSANFHEGLISGFFVLMCVFDLWAPLELPRNERFVRGCPRGCLRKLYFNFRVPERPHKAGVTRECLSLLQARRIRGVFLFGYFILDKQNKVTRQQGETMTFRTGKR